MALKTNFTDDILAESMNGKRQYNFTENSNGTKSIEDVTEYQSVGSNFSAKDINETNASVNQAYEDMGDEFNPEVDYAVGDYAIYNNKVWKFTTAHPAGAWDESHVKRTTILSENRELTENLTFPDGTGFYPDEQDGQKGYNTSPERGADTFFPFSKDLECIKYVCNIIGATSDTTSTVTIESDGFVYAGLLGGNDTYPSATLNGSSMSPAKSGSSGHGRCRCYQTSVRTGDVLKFTCRGGNTTFGLMSYVVYG